MTDPLTTNRIGPALPGVIDKRGDERTPVARRRRPVTPQKAAENDEEEAEPEPESNAPKHVLDDLA